MEYSRANHIARHFICIHYRELYDIGGDLLCRISEDNKILYIKDCMAAHLFIKTIRHIKD